MTDTATPEINVVALMRQVQADAERLRQGLPIGRSMPMPRRAVTSILHLPRLPDLASELPHKDRYSVGELLDRHDTDFLRTAYRAILRRQPDASGQQTYLGGLRAGRLSKIDILGRLRFCREGRDLGVSVRGLLPLWLAHTAYRIPLFGNILAWFSAIVRLPQLVHQWSRFEAFVMFQRGEQTVQINAVLTQLESELRLTRQRLAACEAQLQRQEMQSAPCSTEEISDRNSSGDHRE